jgi:hypothetical protein
MNQEVYEKFKSPDIAIEIEVRIWKWLGHVVRMNDERRAKEVTGRQTRREKINS